METIKISLDKIAYHAMEDEDNTPLDLEVYMRRITECIEDIKKLMGLE